MRISDWSSDVCSSDLIQDLDLYTCGMVLELNGAIASVGAGAACLGHPLEAAAWLARTLAANGEGLAAGDVLLTGALGPVVAFGGGDRVAVKIGGGGGVACVGGGAGERRGGREWV